jgi:hypothetical protein
MTRRHALDHAGRQFDSAAFRDILARRVAIPTESQNPERAPVLARFLGGGDTPARQQPGAAAARHAVA